MRTTTESAISKHSARRHRTIGKALAAGCAAGALSLAVVGLPANPAGASTKTIVLHFYSKEVVNTFFNAANVVIQGYPPVGGHALENDVDYVGTKAHHAKVSTVTDHLYCTVVSAPANGVCSIEIAIGGSLLYSDNVPTNLAGNSGAVPFDGGTGKYAGYSGSAISTSIGNSNNSTLVITLHKQ
jgi:hypothetical protein